MEKDGQDTGWIWWNMLKRKDTNLILPLQGLGNIATISSGLLIMMSYNQILKEHLAGDLLENKRYNTKDGVLESPIATNFYVRRGCSQSSRY